MDKYKRRFIVFLVIFMLLTGILGLAFWPFIKNLQNPEYRELFTAWVASLGFRGALILFGLEVLQIMVAVIPGGPIQLIAGAAYGTWGGLLILTAGCATATTFVFFIVRKFGQPLIIRFFGNDVLNTWSFLRNEKKTALTVFILFLIPGIPKDTLTYLAPLSKLSLLQFTVISVFARLPAMLSSTIMGAAVIQGNWILFFAIFAVTAIVGILGIQFRDRIVKRFKGGAGNNKRARCAIINSTSTGVSMNNDFDVIVIGAGNGGLSAACYLLKEGKKVLVLEKNNLPGGCATSFRRGRFEFEASLHELCLMGEKDNAGMCRKLLDDYGLDVDWVPIHESFNAINTDPKTAYNVSMPTGVQAFIDEMERQCPGSRKPMESMMELARMVSEGVYWLNKYNNELPLYAKIATLFKWPDLLKLVSVSTDEMLRKLGMPDKAREIMESYWEYISVDSTQMNFATYICMVYAYLIKKPWISRMRSHEISLAFDKRIRELGGKIRYNTEVVRIDIKDKRVRGVVLENGEYIACERVISNVMPTVVFSKMVEPKEVPIRDRRLMNARKLGQGAFTIYIGLDASAEELGLKGYGTFVHNTGDTQSQYKNNAAIDTHENYCFTILSNVIPDASPKGTCLLMFTKLYSEDAFADTTEENYFRIKDKIAEETILHFEKTMRVNIRDHIEEISIASPVTWARYIGTPLGDVYGYAPLPWDNMFARIIAAKKQDYTIHGLRFCGGHGTQLLGYSQSYLSGSSQARYMLHNMKKGK